MLPLHHTRLIVYDPDLMKDVGGIAHYDSLNPTYRRGSLLGLEKKKGVDGIRNIPPRQQLITHSEPSRPSSDFLPSLSSISMSSILCPPKTTDLNSPNTPRGHSDPTKIRNF
jgi:hypothetical protein